MSLFFYAGAAGLDTLERAFCIMSPRGDWGVSIARWLPDAQVSRCQFLLPLCSLTNGAESVAS